MFLKKRSTKINSRKMKGDVFAKSTMLKSCGIRHKRADGLWTVHGIEQRRKEEDLS
jgi:hypothetical protein